ELLQSHATRGSFRLVHVAEASIRAREQTLHVADLALLRLDRLLLGVDVLVHEVVDMLERQVRTPAVAREEAAERRSEPKADLVSDSARVPPAIRIDARVCDLAGKRSDPILLRLEIRVALRGVAQDLLLLAAESLRVQ